MRYNPNTDSRTATGTINAPEPRDSHTVVWINDEMIVWGGENTGPFFLNSGGRYNPGTDSWIPTSTNNAPEAREFHTAVSTGSEMIIWAGLNNGFVSMNTGGRYNPDMDSWTPTSTTNVPDARPDTSVADAREDADDGALDAGDEE